MQNNRLSRKTRTIPLSSKHKFNNFYALRMQLFIPRRPLFRVMHFSSKKKKTLQPGMSALNKAKECYRHPIFFAGFFGEQDSFPSLFSCI